MALAVATADDVSNEVAMSAAGTFEACPPILRMSVRRGRPEVAVARRPEADIRLRQATIYLGASVGTSIVRLSAQKNVVGFNPDAVHIALFADNLTHV
ncbi:uncharacterized protein YdhG (YjbR/CyaY superfamily) [Bradyrhizobium diazoefficiens]